MIQRTSTSLEAPASYPDSIPRLAETLLERSGYRALQRVHCEFAAGTLTLRGQVPSFYMKQVAQTLVKNLGEVTTIDNRLVVRDNG